MTMPEQSSTRPVHVLLIDGNGDDHELIAHWIGDQLQLHAVTRGHDGLEHARTRSPDCVLLDFVLPDMDGLDLAGALLALKVPVVVLAAEETPETVGTLMKQGVQEYVVKSSMSPAILMNAIRNAMERSTMHQDLAAQTDTLGRQDQQIRMLLTALTLSEQRERKRIAQLLHDHLQQLLYGVQMRIHILGEDLAQEEPANEEPADFQDDIAGILELVERAIATTRTLAVEISPLSLPDGTLTSGLEWLASHMQSLHGLRVDVTVEADYQIENEDVYALIIQTIRELLFNVVKHANVLTASVRVFTRNEELFISVQDKGVGFDVNHITVPKWRPEEGLGLFGARERLALLNARLEVVSKPGDGARVTVILPPELFSGQAPAQTQSGST